MAENENKQENVVVEDFKRTNAKKSKKKFRHRQQNPVLAFYEDNKQYLLLFGVIDVTLEPCQMCSGAIVQSRMTRVVVGCMNPKAGCAGSILNLLDMPEFNHQVELTTGVMEEECSQMMKSFFKELREARKKKKQLEKEQTGEI